MSLAAQAAQQFGVRALACCLMTSHMHLVVVVERADSLAVLFRPVHGRAGASGPERQS